MDEIRRREYGAQIRQIREAQGLSRTELAELSSVSRAALDNIETGKSTPSADTLEKVFITLGLEPTSFGLIPHSIANYLAALAPSVTAIPPDRIPIVMGLILQLCGQAARPDWTPPSLTPRLSRTQVNIIAGHNAGIDQTND